MASVKELLIAARAKIENEENWIQGCFAKNKQNTPVWSGSPDACKWCAMGAVSAVTSGEGPTTNNVIEFLRLTIGQDAIVSKFNDSHTHAEVLALFDRAIANAD